MGYVDEVLAKVKEKNASEPEFLQAVEEVLESLRPVIDANEELYRKNAILRQHFLSTYLNRFCPSVNLLINIAPLSYYLLLIYHYISSLSML